jgi:hypothetical protein
MKVKVNKKLSNQQLQQDEAHGSMMRLRILPLIISLVSSHAFAATFTQTDWSGGATANTAADPTDQTGWTEYSSADTGVNDSTELTISPSAASVVHTRTDSTEFGVATNFQTHTTHADFSGGSPTFYQTQVNNGAVGIKPAALASVWADKTGTAWDQTLAQSDADAAFADLDGDGDLDMITAGGNTAYGYRNTGTDDSPVWTEVSSWGILPTWGGLGYQSALNVALGDLDGDGDYDLLLSYQTKPVFAVENTGDSSEPAWSRKSAWDLASASTASAPYKITLGDLNGDGVPELIVGGDYSAGDMDVYQFDGATPWVLQSTWTPPDGFGGGPKASIGDLDGDGDPDLVVGWGGKSNLQLITNSVASYPADPTNWTDLGFTGPAWGSSYDYPALADLDSDGDLDLMIGGDGTSTLTFYENSSTTYNTSGTYTSAVIDTGSGNVGYSTLDYTIVTPAGTTLTIDVRSGPTASPDASWTAWADNTDVANGGDISAMGSGRYFQYRANLSTTDTSVTPLLEDITVNYTAYPSASGINYYGNKLSLEILNRTISWTAQTNWNSSAYSPSMGDLNGDGCVDMVYGSGYASSSGAYSGDCSTWTTDASLAIAFTNHSAGTQYLNPAQIELGDLDGDGDLDAMIWSPNADNTQIHVYENTGSAAAPVWSHNQSWEPSGPAGDVALADLDNDGDLDLMVPVWSGSPYPIQGYRNDDVGSGPVWTRYSAWDETSTNFGYSPAPELADIDGDGDYDLVMGRSGIKFVENVGTVTSPSWARNSGWDIGGISDKVPAVADIDDDGDMDVVAGSLGYENANTTTYAASGTFESAIMDFAGATFTTLDYTAKIRTGTGVTISVRAGNTTTPSGVWTGWSAVANGGSLAAYNGYRYMQYKVDLTANGANSLTPEVSDVTINYTGLPSPVELISSPYDSGNTTTNYLTSLSWNETLATNSDVRVQLRSSPDNSAWTSWMGPDGTSSTYWNSANIYGGGCSGSGAITCTTMASALKDGSNDQWFQYKVTLIANGDTAPTLSDLSIDYVANLPPGITLNKTTGLVTTEAATTDTFTVVLDTLPAGDVTVDLSSSDTSEATVSPATLTFTTSDWSSPQTVTVTGVNDSVDDGDIGYTISVNPGSAVDTNYDVLATLTVTGTNTDDDTAGITVNPTSGLTTSETGPASDTFTVVLDSQPLDDVMIDLSSTDTTEGTVSPATLTFTSSDWYLAKTVTVTGVDEYVHDGDIAYNIVTASARSTGDATYRGMNASDVGVTNVDDDVVSVTVSPLTTLTTTEAGGTDSFTVVLGSQPSSNVTIGFSTSNGTEGLVTPGALTFTSSNWNVAQTVKVIGQDDGNSDGDIYYSIFLTDASSSDPDYNGYNVTDFLTAVNQDDDMPSIVVSPASGVMTAEGGAGTVLRVRLGSQPISAVTLNIDTDDHSEGLASTTSASFDSGNWNAWHYVNIASVDDAVVDGDVLYNVVFTPASGGDVSYTSLSAVNVSVTNQDNDGASLGSAAFSQTNWGDGTAGNSSLCAEANGVWVDNQCTALDPNNEAGWQLYYSKDTDLTVINNGADLQTAITPKTLKHSTNTDFAISVSSSRYSTQDDFASGASLSNTKVNPGAISLKPATLTNAWTAKPAWDFADGMSYDHPALADLDGDGDMDLLVGRSNGDTEGYRNIGTDDAPVWESYPAWRVDRYFETAYQNNAAPILGDFDGDGDNDLFLGFGGNIVYGMENIGSKEVAIWSRKSAWDLTNVAGAVSRGVMANLDGSGYPELLVGGGYNYYGVYVFQFNGTTWSEQTTWEPLAHTIANGFPSNEDVARAAAGDLDDDGDVDLVVGYRYRDAAVGFENTGTSSSPTWSNSFNQTLSVAGDFHTPVLADMDNDGDLDFYIGSAAGGTLYYYENTGTVYNNSGTYTSSVIDTGGHDGFTTLDFTAVTPTNTTLTVDLQAADSADFLTNSTGWQTDIANGADISALLGSRRYVQYRVNFATTDTSVTPLLEDITISYVVLPWGYNVVAVDDALNLKIASRTVAWTAESAWDSGVASGYTDGNNNNPRPALGDIDGDGDLDLLRGDGWSYSIGFYRNDGNNVWTYMPDWDFACCAGSSSEPVLADMDADGDLDVMMAVSNSIVGVENIGDSTTPDWGNEQPAKRKAAWFIGSGYTTVDLADLDNDGDYDAMVGDTTGLWAYENVGTAAAPSWQANSTWSLPEVDCPDCQWWQPQATFADLDGDGDYDMLVSNNGSDWTPRAFENYGTESSPAWGRKAAWDPPSFSTWNHFDLADLDDDGDIDMLYGKDGTTIAGYRNTGVSSYAASGGYTSAVLDFGAHLGFTTVDYNAAVPAGTSLTVETRSGSTATPDGSWSGWQTVASGADISGYGTNHYVQYRVSMTSDVGNTASPRFYDISFNYIGVAPEQSLISNAYNTTVSTALISGLGWTETLEAGTDVRVQVRSAADNAGAPGTWSDWVGPDGTSASYWNSANTYAGGCSGSGSISCTFIPAVLRNGSGNQWLQYKVTLAATGATQSTLSDITVYFDTGTAAGSKVVVSPTTLTTTENVGVTPTATFDVSLDADPASPVDIYFSSSDLTEGTISPASVTLSAGDIGPKTITVTSVDDAVRDLDVDYSVFTSATISADANYNNLVVDEVTVTNVDDDLSAGGITVSATSGLTTTETGGTATFSIVLNSAPTQDVTISVTSDNTLEGVASPALLTFTTLNWNDAASHTVTITGQDDTYFDQNISYTVVTGPTVSTDLNYDGLAVPDISVTNLDDESADVILTPDDSVNGLTVNENGGCRTFTVKLASQPIANVQFSLSVSDTSEGSIFSFPYYFTSSNWNVEQLGTICGVNDDIIDGDINFLIMTSNFISSDPNFSDVNPSDFTATNLDNDGVYSIAVTPVTGLNTSEDGGTTVFKITLASKPSADVIVYLTSSAPGEGYVTDHVVLSPDDISYRGTLVHVFGVDDNVIDGDQPYTIITSAAVSNDPNYNGIDPADVSVTNLATNTKSILTDQAGANAGRSVAFADVNGDGYDDAIVGAPGYDGTYSNGGRVVVYNGSSIGSVSGASWSAEGDQVDAFFGQSVANAGDVNHDGYDDVIIGAYGRDISGVDEGRVYIYHGSASGLGATPDQTLSGTVGSGFFGYSVASAGDVNGDTYDDVIVGAYGEDKAYVFHGSTAGVVGSAATTLVGDQAGSQFGISVAEAGDVNGDTYDDVIVGADLYDNGETDEGRVLVYHGSASGVSAIESWSKEVNQASAFFGHSVAGVGDVNGDGYGDVLIGAYGFDNGQTDEGRVYAYYGSASGLSTTVNLIMESNQANAYYGYAVGYAGDVNNDGYGDIIVGAPSYDNGQTDEGRAVVYFGSSSGINSTERFSYEVDQDSANLGVAVAGNGLFNGDLYADLLVGADLYDGSQTDEGVGKLYRSPALNYGVTVTKSATDLVTSETGTTTSYSLVLTAPPTENVVLESFVGDASEGGISGALKTFTPANWYVPQTVSVRGVDDSVDDGDVFYDIVTLARSADANYDGVPVETVSVMNINDDFSANVTASDTSIAEEGGNTGTFTFSRTGDTTSPMSVYYSVGGTAINSNDYSGLSGVAVIPAGQPSVDVVVTPVDDAIADPGETVSVTIMSHSGYLLGGNTSAAMTIIDNDAAGITVSPVSGLNTNEAGGTASFTVVLNTQPTSDVTIALSSDTPAEGLPVSSSLTFTNLNWSTAQTVTVVGQDDAAIDGDVAYNIVTGAAVSGDGNYSGMIVPNVALTNLDDDSLPNVSIAATTATVDENGSGSGALTISRSGLTAASLTVSYFISGSAMSNADYYYIGSTVVIPAGSSSVTLPIVPIDDSDVEGDEVVIATLASHSGYIVAQPKSATVTIIDDDEPTPPLANFALSQSVGEGTTASVSVYLSKTALSYPVLIPYTVSGTAINPADHDAADGTIVIPSGTEATTTFNIVDDGAGDPDETVIFTMGTLTNADVGARNTHTVTLVEANKSPEVSLDVTQGAINTNLIVTGNGDVTVTATVDDPNPLDSHVYDWTLSNNNLVDIDDGDPSTFVFSPAALLDGFYKVRLTVTDDGTPAKSTTVDLLLEVTSIAPALTTADSDGDGVTDDLESTYDSDKDGIPDYLDDSILLSNELPMDASQEGYILRTDAGLTLRLGDTALAAGSDGAGVTVDDIASYGGGEGDPGTASAEDTVPNSGGYFDFKIVGLPEAGQTARIVIPQLNSLPAGAVYRKYDPATGWQDFVVDANNLIASAPGLPGECPLPGDASFTSGLTKGDYCIQLTIQDGGANDMDGIANHVIEDPSNIGKVTSSSGGGAISLPWLLLLLGYFYSITARVRMARRRCG